MERHQALADLWVGSWIDLTTLGIAEEVVQDIETTLSLIVIGSRSMVTNVGGVMLNWVVAHAISLRLLWLVVTVVRWVVVWLSVSSVLLVHLWCGLIIVTGWATCEFL